MEQLCTYASLADQLGYSRLWLSEHHNNYDNQCWLNPEVFLPVIARQTQNIRIGAAGLILSAHAPYRIAYTFKMLGSIFNGRIDLGLSSGYPGTAFCENFFPDITREATFEGQLAVLFDIFNEKQLLADNNIVLPPFNADLPAFWLLGSSYKKLNLALQFGSNFSRSLFHFGADLAANEYELNTFREQFHNKFNRLPSISLAFSGCCHKSRSMARRHLTRAKLGIVTDNLVGSAGEISDELHRMSEIYKVDEFIFLNLANTDKGKAIGIELLSRECNLGG